MTAEPTTLTPLQRALREARRFAVAHGVSARVTPDDFGIQRSEAGFTTATYVDADHAVTAHIDRHGNVKVAVAQLDWIHDESDEDRDICDFCEVIDPADFRPIETVYLPGDAPAEESAHA